MKTKRFAALALALTMAMGTFTGCSGNNSSSTADTGDTIRIGAIAPLTGGASDYGITATNGLKLAVEEVNANGGVLGRQVVVDYQDDENDTTKAVNAYNKLKGDGMVALWGAVTSKPAISVSSKAAKDNLPMMTPPAQPLPSPRQAAMYSVPASWMPPRPRPWQIMPQMSCLPRR